ncbi:beta-defensin 5 precursor [Rattus norvegicus]|uniref:Beta-defensin 5 n=1 Tax=Rattus norvegicus TaxID=10116 RepID=DEFB5_RAT|nr:beta-defensin 5 precursor [Rattus norvegicus]Q32ZI3.1 RecName: Full=Beta-defensin 5; Short=BD-5; AltName: Full=Defensin, beta 5; Flags: Precursor [Rattus norvegicus]AAT51879.1 beta-defensin 5 [Rattus norvegicus]|eukprot:NP_001032638.1 beta-defensin 5 precursor [Rattus norvegicus]
MRIHYLLFSFLLVLLSPLSVFTQSINNPVSCVTHGGICWGRCPGSFRQIGTCGLGKVRCCKKK